MAIVSLTGGAEAEALDLSCGDSVVVQRSDTLSGIADRCDVSEGSLIAANPGIQGSNDLSVGMTLRLGSAGQSVGSKLNRFGREANNALGSLAGAIGSSAQDLLNRNPDLKSRVDSLENKMGLGNDTRQASLSVSPSVAAPGSQVSLTATGLPKDSPISIGAGHPGSAYEIFANARSSSSGRLDTSVTVPAWAAQGGASLVFVLVGSDHDVETRSGRVALTR